MAELLGCGLYSVREASRLLKVSAPRIRRWAMGYSFRTQRGDLHSSGPVWRRELLEEEDGSLILTFLDLIEAKLVVALRTHGISWNVIRRSEQRAQELFRTSHPFATRRILTDGSLIFADIIHETGERGLIRLVEGQLVFRRMVEPLLFGVDFEKEQAARWWPMGQRRRVVLDPERSFGRPIETYRSIPTHVLAAGYRAEESYDRVARWYGTQVRSVKDAVEFEASLAA